MATQDFTPEELATEEWRDVVDYEGWYQVSNLGRVRSARTRSCTFAGKMLRPCASSSGYPYVNLTRGAHTGKVFRVHRLVAAAFIGPCPDGMEVNHIDSDTSNSRVGNLEYVTRLENIQHAVRHRRMSKPRARSAKLLEEDVVEIRRSILAGIKARDLAKQYNVTPMSISHIKKGNTWARVAEFRDSVVSLGAWRTTRRRKT